jgi:hypothetical protein
VDCRGRVNGVQLPARQAVWKKLSNG